MELRGPRVLLRPTTEADLERLLAILSEPEVARWWGSSDLPRLRRELLDETESLVVELVGEVVGLVMVSEQDDHEYRHAGLDISLASDHHGQGLGREALSAVIDHLIADRGHHRITIDPAADNQVAIRCYSAVGFRPVGVLRQYWRAPDGQWRDGLLMDLLAEDWRRR